MPRGANRHHRHTRHSSSSSSTRACRQGMGRGRGCNGPLRLSGPFPGAAITQLTPSFYHQPMVPHLTQLRHSQAEVLLRLDLGTMASTAIACIPMLLFKAAAARAACLLCTALQGKKQQQQQDCRILQRVRVHS